ncbi:MAG: ABC transporter ATP-binding protein [Maritimibacter sp.]
MTNGIEVEKLGFSYGPKRALDGVSFAVERGQFCALLGPNGAGKSTLFGLLTRLFTAHQGRIALAGHDLGQAPRKALSKLGVVFQQPTLDLDLTVRRNLSYFAALHGITGRERALRIDAALERLDMKARENEVVRALNGGHRRRTELARALLHRPEVLLLDEPTVGLDASARRAITDHVHTLASETGMTVLWATHLTDEIENNDRVIMLHQGQIIADGLAQDIAGVATLEEKFLEKTMANI